MIPKYEKMNKRSVQSNLNARIQSIVSAYQSGLITFNEAIEEIRALGFSDREANEILDPYYYAPPSDDNDDEGEIDIVPPEPDDDKDEELLPPEPEESEDELIVEDDIPVLPFVGVGLIAMAALIYFFVLDGEPDGY